MASSQQVVAPLNCIQPSSPAPVPATLPLRLRGQPEKLVRPGRGAAKLLGQPEVLSEHVKPPGPATPPTLLSGLAPGTARRPG
jgi:hypothetical protein